MKWSHEYVWSKVEELVPNARLCGYDLPKAVEKAAVELFLLDEGMHNGSYRAYVIEECIKELRSKGWLDFGDVEVDWG
ncbi:hypothetical protein D3C71_1907400 [compost metagenome]